ncbi:M48 family metallopeptidase [Sphingomonas sp. ID1715]|uniref:M48 family metallopeptidase n=1 Tax=Sphingomonas sp. ID1715 TaxID=1656898 RepID=UPI0014890EE8|nr:SprT family zinc-dependent metalloprotease [Sphingomonas sp. ID1715]NNM76504.1 M48 family metallopeptidase [Sphingomonas sp. ID1715]
MTRDIPGSVEFGGQEIEFALTKTARRKTVAITVGFDGVRVLAPSDLADARISDFVRKKASWILRKLAMYAELSGVRSSKEFVSGETFHYLGRPYRLKIIRDPQAIVTRVSARGSSLVAPVLPDQDPLIAKSAVRSGLRHWYIARASRKFSERMQSICLALGIEPGPISVVDQSKRWGSCDAKGRIRLNWRLVMAPVSLIDYVLAHEACHRIELTHSRKFWRKLETVMPDYEDRIRRLDALGHALSW